MTSMSVIINHLTLHRVTKLILAMKLTFIKPVLPTLWGNQELNN